MSDSLRTTLDANKREAFDAMRAYHQSEIEHKSHAISMLTTVLTGVGAVFAAIIIPSAAIANAGAIAFLAAAAASLGSYLVVSSTNTKIGSDHKRYAAFGAEYVNTCRLLGLFDAIQIGDCTITLKTDDKLGQGKGYINTQKILQKFGWFVATLGWVAFAYVVLAR